MGLLDNVRGNASEVNPADAARQYGFLLIHDEAIIRAYSASAASSCSRTGGSSSSTSKA